VRLLLNLPRGKAYTRTLEIWAQAFGMVQAERSPSPPFTLVAMPLGEFLAQPDWCPEIAGRWAQVTPLNPVKQVREAVLDPQDHFSPDQLQQDLQYMQTISWRLKENPPEMEQPAFPEDFIHLLGLLHAPVQEWTKTRDVGERRPPLSAVALLRAYLARRADLREMLLAEMRKGQRRKWWPQEAVLRHMQRVIETFLNYHGWYNRAFFRARAQGQKFFEGQYPYSVEVTTLPVMREYLQYYNLDGDLKVGAALSWVLWALFAYGNEIGLQKPPYW
jgi:hypothetical protein